MKTLSSDTLRMIREFVMEAMTELPDRSDMQGMGYNILSLVQEEE